MKIGQRVYERSNKWQFILLPEEATRAQKWAALFSTSFPGSLFFPSLEPFFHSKEGKKRDPGNEVALGWLDGGTECSPIAWPRVRVWIFFSFPCNCSSSLLNVMVTIAQGKIKYLSEICKRKINLRFYKRRGLSMLWKNQCMQGPTTKLRRN